MANVATQFGFKHQGYLGGGAVDYQPTPYPIRSGYSTVINFCDPVIFSSDGTITLATPNLATTGSIVGIFQGCQYIPSTGLSIPTWLPYWPGAAATTATAYVIDAPNAKFLVAAYSTAVGTTLLGNYINFTFGGLTAGTTGGAYSVATVDQATATSAQGTTTQTLPFRVLSMYPGVGNGSDPTTNFNWVVVTFGNQFLRSLGN
jgi:hypothetical protein